MLSCRSIQLSYGTRPVLRSVALEIRPGEICALVGPSGAGKSSLLRCLAFLENTARGEIILDDHVYSLPREDKLSEAPPWPRVTAVFQQLFLWPSMTLRENIELPLRLRKIEGAAARVESLIDRFAMVEFVDRYPNQVSGGQRQRAALARALALQPSYVLLDEVTSAVDVEQAVAIGEHLVSLKQEGIGILIITHHVDFLRRTADTIAFMENGEIKETGPREMLSTPRFPALRRLLCAFGDIETPSSYQGEAGIDHVRHP